MENYVILLVDGEPSYTGILEAILRPFGALVDHHITLDSALDAAQQNLVRLILVDPDLVPTAAASITRSRSAAGNERWGIIAFADDAPGDGFDGWLPKAFAAQDLVALVSETLGMTPPVAERGGEQLARLLGQEQADAMIDRLYLQLADAVDAIDAGGDPATAGHRIGGLAGTLGFPILCEAWLALQHGAPIWPTVRRLTLDAIEQHGAPA